MKETMKRKLCLDYGSKRIGIALSDPTCTIAYPLDVMERSNVDNDIRKIIDLILHHDVSTIIVGLPVRLSGEVGTSASEVLEFVNLLKDSLEDVEIVTWDERLTTAFAEKELLRDNVRRKKRKKVIDKVAATVILQSYLDSEQWDD